MTDQTVKLPELPKGRVPSSVVHIEGARFEGGVMVAPGVTVEERHFTADQMRAYATQAVLEERERCANAAKEAEIRRVSIAMKMPRRIRGGKE